MPFYGNQHTEKPMYTYDDLVRGVRALAADLGRSPTTAEASSDDRLPCLSTIYKHLNGGWNDLLADAGLSRTAVGSYDASDERDMRHDLRRVISVVESDALTHRQYDEHGEFPTSVVKEHFGSWRAACDAADILAGERHGTPCRGPSGVRLDSQYELAVATYLHDAGLAYDVHPEVEGTRWRGDFYLSDVDLWVEVDGYAEGTRPNAHGFAKKIAHLRDAEQDVAVVRCIADLEAALRERDVVVT
ncbi:hypothetical protein GCM10009037_16340 [Halarchaeum grantii]|uniref:Uncharacterized protein n=1 Tax=Halarchaeum grantii TaxID=1193105 RepID=A0A830EVD4_9EURY|nr:hypothetical protein [Halarchaeum grantii]GGL33434.1 hypothetical protein GCM10009037_16340 [Halarchaeum grantii]